MLIRRILNHNDGARFITPPVHVTADGRNPEIAYVCIFVLLLLLFSIRQYRYAFLFAFSLAVFI